MEEDDYLRTISSGPAFPEGESARQLVEAVAQLSISGDRFHRVAAGLRIRSLVRVDVGAALEIRERLSIDEDELVRDAALIGSYSLKQAQAPAIPGEV